MPLLYINEKILLTDSVMHNGMNGGSDDMRHELVLLIIYVCFC